MPELSSYDTPYKSQLASHSSFIKSCESNVGYLLHQCNALSKFIVESSSHTQNALMVNDSQSIRVITILTLVYLPASFVAVSTRSSTIFMNDRLICKQTFFGMQFFGTLILPKLWVFFLSAVLLTLLTLGGWLWSTSRSRALKNLAKTRYQEENC